MAWRTSGGWGQGLAVLLYLVSIGGSRSGWGWGEPRGRDLYTDEDSDEARMAFWSRDWESRKAPQRRWLGRVDRGFSMWCCNAGRVAVIVIAQYLY